MKATAIGLDTAKAVFRVHEIDERGQTTLQTRRKRLRRAQLVTFFVTCRDAEAICEAVRRPNMRFVAIKTVAQQKTAHAASGSPAAGR